MFFIFGPFIYQFLVKLQKCIFVHFVRRSKKFISSLHPYITLHYIITLHPGMKTTILVSSASFRISQYKRIPHRWVMAHSIGGPFRSQVRSEPLVCHKAWVKLFSTEFIELMYDSPGVIKNWKISFILSIESFDALFDSRTYYLLVWFL